MPHMELKKKLVVHASAKLDSLVLSVTDVTLLTTGLTIIALMVLVIPMVQTRCRPMVNVAAISTLREVDV